MDKNIMVSNPEQSIPRKNYDKLSKWYDVLSIAERKFQFKRLKMIEKSMPGLPVKMILAKPSVN